MKNIKALLIAGVAGLMLSGTASAQLSDRVNNPTTFKVGTRPVQGNLGISLGIGKRDVDNWAGIDNEDETAAELREFSGLPLTTFKYYSSDNLVFLIGFKGETTKKTFKGDIDPIVNSGGTQDEVGADYNPLISEKYKTVDSRYLIAPGVEHHFIGSNILDVFVRASIPVGFVVDVAIHDYDYEEGNYIYNSQKRRSMLMGFDCGIGVQMFIADLPFAIGAETGIAGYGYYRNKTKVIDQSKAGDVTVDQVYFVEGDGNKDANGDIDPTETKYSSLKARTFEVQPSFRFSLSYFFKR